MRLRQWAVVTALLAGAGALSGCSADPSGQVETYYYKGVNTTHSADGQQTAKGETLLRRVFDGPASHIVEDVITKDEQGVVQENTLTFVVTGSTFKDSATGFTGELQGDPWDWSSWKATGMLPNGLALESLSSISPNKVIVDMTFKSGDAVQFTVKHEVAAIFVDHYQDLRAQWLAQ
jgi:hypothetical protein